MKKKQQKNKQTNKQTNKTKIIRKDYLILQYSSKNLSLVLLIILHSTALCLPITGESPKYARSTIKRYKKGDCGIHK